MASNVKSSKDLKDLPAYELMYEETLDDLKAAGLCFKHTKSGARICVISNDDENKVFCIGFRTPPFDSTGVAHIVEHTVLCGSKKFPLKDPFIELAKGSLNTFLNAMTFSDKTIYPVASCNDKDFRNLCDVYMDAVLNPNIHYKEEIFKQEGWHYELESTDAPLKINGIVYSEMKGAFSSPDQVLSRYSQASLFPDTSYAVESGGDPDVIPELTYEEFKSFHKRYYHPVNSYIYIYGNIDVEEQLEWLDKEYLSAYDKITVNSELKMQSPIGFIEKKASYSISENDDTKDKSYFSYNVVLKEKTPIKVNGTYILLDVLFDAPGAPVKQAILDAGIGNDVTVGLSDILQPYVEIDVKNTNPERKDDFLKIVKDTIASEIKKGINKNSLRAAINKSEFKYREADFGSFPKGLMYIINSYSTWLYDDKEAFTNFYGNDIYAELKSKVDDGFFEELAKELFFENEISSLFVLEPEKGLNAKKDEALAKKLADYKASLSKEELEKLVADTKALKEYQEEPSTKEQLSSIPLLSISDIKKETTPVECVEEKVSDIPVLSEEVFTNGIAYIKFLFDMAAVPKELVPYTGLVSAVFAYVDTKKHSFQDLDNEINIRTGGINGIVSMINRRESSKDYLPVFLVSAKVLNGNIKDAFELSSEIINTSLYDDTKRLYEIIAELKSKLYMQMNMAGHVAAIGRAASYYSNTGVYSDLNSGISYYEFICDIFNNFEEKKEEVINNIKETAKLIFTKGNLLVNVTADKAGIESVKSEIPLFAEGLLAGSEGAFHKALAKGSAAAWTGVDIPFEISNKKEGFKTSGQVQFVARCGNYLDMGYKYCGALTILKTILGYDYLWNNIRVKGGAYGCMGGMSPTSGNSYFVSYRDPNLKETDEVYKNIGSYIKNFAADEREMTKYIIGTMSSVDTPLTPSMRGSRSMNAYLSGTTTADFQKERDEILSADASSIKATADLVEAVVNQDYFCVIGSEAKIEECKDMFNEIKLLV